MVWIEHIGAQLVLPLLGPLELELVASEVNIFFTVIGIEFPLAESHRKNRIEVDSIPSLNLAENLASCGELCS